MTKITIARVHRAFNIAVAVSIILAGICLMLGCLRIYYDYAPSELSLFGMKIPFPSFIGAKNYSAALIADTFSYIAIPVYACLVLVVGSFVFEMISPLDEKKKPTKKGSEKLLLVGCDEMIRKLVKAGIIAVCCVIFLCYALNPSNFAGISSEEVTNAVMKAMLVMIPCLVVSFCSLYFLAPQRKNRKKMNEDNCPLCSTTVTMILRIAIIVFGVAALLVGLCGGGTKDVLTKAVNICTECIGLG